MAHNTWNGVPVPDAGDGILSSLEAAFAAAGVIQSAASVAAARTALAAAETAGTLPTEAHPAFFAVGKNVYRSVGTKSNAGVFALSPINEMEFYEDYQHGGLTVTRTAGSQHAIVTSSLPAQPYDRGVVAFGLCNARSNGVLGLRMLINNKDGQTARYTDDNEPTSQTVFNMGTVKAGVDPQVILALSFGGTTTSTAVVSSSSDSCRLAVLAFPITMA